MYGWKISLKIASLDWSSRSKEIGKPSKMSHKGGGSKQYEVRTGKKIFSPLYGSSYVDAVRSSDNGSRPHNFNEVQSKNPGVNVFSEVVKWDKDAYDNSWLNVCAVGVL